MSTYRLTLTTPAGSATRTAEGMPGVREAIVHAIEQLIPSLPDDQKEQVYSHDVTRLNTALTGPEAELTLITEGSWMFTFSAVSMTVAVEAG